MKKRRRERSNLGYDDDACLNLMMGLTGGKGFKLLICIMNSNQKCYVKSQKIHVESCLKISGS